MERKPARSAHFATSTLKRQSLLNHLTDIFVSTTSGISNLGTLLRSWHRQLIRAATWEELGTFESISTQTTPVRHAIAV
ncbi:MAG: hypothetical protein ACE5MK_05725 [Acidobacteriota bacterium]